MKKESLQSVKPDLANSFEVESLEERLEFEAAWITVEVDPCPPPPPPPAPTPPPGPPAES